jgi:hypothetical protein
MRTTLDISDDVLFAAKEIAQREKKSIGQVISELARSAFQAPASGSGKGKSLKVAEPLAAYGIKPLPSRGGLVTNELIDRLRKAEGI